MPETVQDIVPPRHILIVEDDDAAAHLIEKNLRRAGLECGYTRVRNGEAALHILNNGITAGELPPVSRLVILLDIRMPKMDGIQLIKLLKGSTAYRRIPVIMLTTSDRHAEVEACYEAGCSFYIKKQVDYARFITSIKAMAAFVMECELPLYGDTTHG